MWAFGAYDGGSNPPGTTFAPNEPVRRKHPQRFEPGRREDSSLRGSNPPGTTFAPNKPMGRKYPKRSEPGGREDSSLRGSNPPGSARTRTESPRRGGLSLAPSPSVVRRSSAPSPVSSPRRRSAGIVTVPRSVDPVVSETLRGSHRCPGWLRSYTTRFACPRGGELYSRTSNGGAKHPEFGHGRRNSGRGDRKGQPLLRSLYVERGRRTHRRHGSAAVQAEWSGSSPTAAGRPTISSRR